MLLRLDYIKQSEHKGQKTMKGNHLTSEEKKKK